MTQRPEDANNTSNIEVKEEVHYYTPPEKMHTPEEDDEDAKLLLMVMIIVGGMMAVLATFLILLITNLSGTAETWEHQERPSEYESVGMEFVNLYDVGRWDGSDLIGRREIERLATKSVVGRLRRTNIQTVGVNDY